MAGLSAAAYLTGFEERRARTMLKIGSNFYILASSLASYRSTRVLAGRRRELCGPGRSGRHPGVPARGAGAFPSRYRYLSRSELKIPGQSPTSSTFT